MAQQILKTKVDGSIVDAFPDVHNLVELAPPAEGDELLVYDPDGAAGAKFKKLTVGAANIRGAQNDIINGAFQFWQRGSSFDPIGHGGYSADRFVYYKSGNMAHIISRDTDVPGTSPYDVNYSFKVDCKTADGDIIASDYCALIQKIEGYNFHKYQGQYATLSFWVKATVTGTYCVSFRSKDLDRSYVAEYTVNSANTWEKKTVTLKFDASGGGWGAYTNDTALLISWALAAGSDLQTTKDAWQTTASPGCIATSNQVNACVSTDNNFWLAKVKFELGQYATEFVTPDFATELERCQRYFEKSYDYSYAPGAISDKGRHTWEAVRGSTTYHRTTVPYLTRKRNTPAVTLYSGNSGTSGKIYNASQTKEVTGTAGEAGEGRSYIYASDVTTVEGDVFVVQWVADAEL